MSAEPDQRPPLWAGHIVLHSRDTRRSGEFYQKLGMRPVAILDEVAVLELRGGTHLVVRHDPDGAGAPASFDLMVDDLDGTWERLRSIGVLVSEVDKDERAIHRIFTITDPDGNTIVVNDSHVVGTV